MKCTVTGDDMVTCQHCLDPNYLVVEEDNTPDYETIGRPFQAQFRGVCTVERRHTYKKGDKVSRVQRADNPTILVSGVACKHCSLLLPRGKV